MSNNKAHKLLLTLFCFMVGLGANAQSVFGKWRTVDDVSGITKGIVEIYEKNGLLQAKIVQILEKGRENAVCVKCKGDLKNTPVKGLHVMKDFKRNSKGEYKGSYLLEPESGTTFRGKVWLNPEDKNKLMVRGYLAFFYRTQTWHRIIE
nr:DUF2147 domain-containing protein [Allomuricauda sp.]